MHGHLCAWQGMAKLVCIVGIFVGIAGVAAQQYGIAHHNKNQAWA